MTDRNEKQPSARRKALKMAVVASAALLGARSGSASPSLRVGPPPHPSPVPRGAQCLLRGSTVLTAEGMSRVEDLVIGDVLPTMFGGLSPIQWIGRYTVKRSNSSTPWPLEARPVRIARSALAPDQPRTDLFVSQAHGLFFDNMLVSAGCLINGTTITLDNPCAAKELEFFHIKLAKHDVIYAEGVAVETLLEVDESADNFAEYFRTYGVPTGGEVPCLPVVSHMRRDGGLKGRIHHATSWVDRRRQVRAVRDRLAWRAMTLSPEPQVST